MAITVAGSPQLVLLGSNGCFDWIATESAYIFPARPRIFFVGHDVTGERKKKKERERRRNRRQDLYCRDSSEKKKWEKNKHTERREMDFVGSWSHSL